MLMMTPVLRQAETIQKERKINRGIHSKFIEHSQQSLGTLNIGRSRVQVTDQMNTKQIPLTGYENFHQELQTYPVGKHKQFSNTGSTKCLYKPSSTFASKP